LITDKIKIALKKYNNGFTVFFPEKNIKSPNEKIHLKKKLGGFFGGRGAIFVFFVGNLI
jgi:hypothetical protein